ncbi:hypothetical protein ENSA5_58240 [Enhygromyxa salina]|uniref:Coenzyme Q (Ubiquinone) biosynthesis protein Coq4 n=1 Tax=Enhygromyxa salina TaxID=215803 RepID=A0A2S9XE08_9BACT|nr:hypothetical protein [Enhygromyxa salina]PRP91087.1 hypothetical protein ENSA5_58240 [Enhygromyxa salina]
MDVTRSAYQDQDSPLTLREGLDEYYRDNPKVTPPDEASDEGARFFASHDVAHVVFGTNTQILDETITDLWQIFGLDISAWEYARQGAAAPEVREVFRELGLRGLAKGLALLPRYVGEIWRRTRRMHKPWPWTEFGEYLDRPLAEIRAEFGIEVLPAS